MITIINLVLNLAPLGFLIYFFHNMIKERRRMEAQKKELDYLHFQLDSSIGINHQQTLEKFTYPKPWVKRRAWLPKKLNDERIWLTTYYTRENVTDDDLYRLNYDETDSRFYTEEGTFMDVLKADMK